MQARAAAEEGEGVEGAERVRVMPLVIKADVQGSAEAVRDALANLACDQVGRHLGAGRVACACAARGGYVRFLFLGAPVHLLAAGGVAGPVERMQAWAGPVQRTAWPALYGMQLAAQ